MDEAGVQDGKILLSDPGKAHRLTGTWLFHSGNGAESIPDSASAQWRSWTVPDGQETLLLDTTEQHPAWLRLDFELSDRFENHSIDLMIPTNGNYTVVLNGRILKHYQYYGEIVQTGPSVIRLPTQYLNIGQNELRLMGDRLIGISGPSPEIFMGTPEVINERYVFRWAWYPAMAVLCIFLGFYHWQMYFKRREAVAYFWFGCVLLSNSLILMGSSYILFALFPPSTWVWTLWWAAIPMAVFSYVYFFAYTFGYPLGRVGKAILGALLLWMIFIPLDFLLHDWTKLVFTVGIPLMGPISLVFYAFGYWVLIRAIREKQVGASTMTVGFTALIIGTMNDQLVNLNLYLAPLVLGECTVFFMACLTVAQANRFSAVYRDLDVSKSLVERYNRSLEEMVAERTTQLRQKTNDIQNMLQTMQQGIAAILDDKTIHPEYSAYMEQIFETDEIAGSSVLTLLFSGANLSADTINGIESALESSIGESRINYEFNEHLLITEFQITLPSGKQKTLEVSWDPICNEEDDVEKILLVIRDVTELRVLQEQASKQRRELDIISQILNISQEKMHDFIDSSQVLLDNNQELIEKAESPSTEVIELLFRNMHTVKGNARTLGFSYIAHAAHEVENDYDDFRTQQPSDWEKEHLLEQLYGLRQIVEEYSLINEVKLNRTGPGRRGAVESFLMLEKTKVDQILEQIDAVSQDGSDACFSTLQKIQTEFRALGAQPVANVLAHIIESLPSLAHELGKEPPQVVINDHNIWVKNQIFGLLRDVFIHLLRNSLDHGIEAPDQRDSKDKKAAGVIEIDLTCSHDHLEIVVSDDGAGLAVDALYKKGLDSGGLVAGKKYTDSEIAEQIFSSGISTASAVSAVSGRGVGLDAVRGFLSREGGSVDIRFLGEKDSAGFRTFAFVIKLPAKFAAKL